MRIWGGDRTDGYGGVKEGAVSVLGTQLIPRIQGGGLLENSGGCQCLPRTNFRYP